MKHTFSVQKLLIENNVVSELMWKNILEAGRPRVTKQRMHVAFWMHKTTATHSDNFLLSHWNNECRNKPQCHVKRTVTVLLVLFFLRHYKKIMFFLSDALNKCRR